MYSTCAAARYFVACSIKVYVLSISHKSTATVPLKSLDKENPILVLVLYFCILGICHKSFRLYQFLSLTLDRICYPILTIFLILLHKSEVSLQFYFLLQVISRITHISSKVLFLIHYSYQNDLTTVQFY